MISLLQRPLPDNTQHSQQTNFHAPGGIRTHNLGRRAAADLRLRPRGHWDRHYPAHSIILFSCCKESVSVIICICSLELVLKQEQEEYQREGIEWKKIDYFNNQIICDLVEQPHKGVIAIIDEACINVGKVTDEVFCYRIIVRYIMLCEILIE